jgi:hypothetical protein
MFKVYWTDHDHAPCAQDFEGLTEALAHCQYLRDVGRRFVTMVSENPNCTSLPGVDEVKDVVNYDGWISRRK